MTSRLRSGARRIGWIAWTSIEEFIGAHPFPLAAALSYYTLLSIAPLLLVVTSFAGLMLGDADIRGELVEQARQLIGEDGAQILQTVSENVSSPRENVLSMSVGMVLVLFGASTVFAQLQFILNRIWGVEAVPSNAVVGFLRARLVSLAIILGLGFMLLVSLVLSAVLTGLSGLLSDLFPGAAILARSLEIGISLGFVTVLLALLFRYVPDAEIAWQDTVIGAVITAILFTLGKYVIGLYLGQASVGSAYGAAGSAVVFMVWVYYASLILLLGAAVTKTVARYRGHPVIPSAHARSLRGAGAGRSRQRTAFQPGKTR